MEKMMIGMRRSSLLSLVFMGAVFTAACGGTAQTAPPPNQSLDSVNEGDVATADLMEHHRYHHHGGVSLFIAMSLDTLGVADKERTSVEKIRADLHTDIEPAHAAEQTLASTLADGLESGAFDAAKVDAALAQAGTAAATIHTKSIDGLNELHALLTPAERAALVDKVEAHWAVWQKANAEDSAAADEDGDLLSTVATDLQLTPDQVSKIRAGLTERMKDVPRLDPQEVAKHLKAFGDAFRSEKFDAKELSMESDTNSHLMAWGAAHMAHFIEVASPILTPEQRTKLAHNLRMHATHDPSAKESP